MTVNSNMNALREAAVIAREVAKKLVDWIDEARASAGGRDTKQFVDNLASVVADARKCGIDDETIAAGLRDAAKALRDGQSSMPKQTESASSEQRLRKECERLSRNDVVLRGMLDSNVPLTREHYIEKAYAGDVPDPWTAEHELELPEPFQRME